MGRVSVQIPAQTSFRGSWWETVVIAYPEVFQSLVLDREPMTIPPWNVTNIILQNMQDQDIRGDLLDSLTERQVISINDILYDFVQGMF